MQKNQLLITPLLYKFNQYYLLLLLLLLLLLFTCLSLVFFIINIYNAYVLVFEHLKNNDSLFNIKYDIFHLLCYVESSNLSYDKKITGKKLRVIFYSLFVFWFAL